jgi:four helix bundle protein
MRIELDVFGLKAFNVRDHRDLEVWQKAMDLAHQTYMVTKGFPSEERFGLSAQMRRASISVPCNIAEGAARRTTKDFVGFIHTARGSLAELETQVLLASRLGLLEQTTELLASVREVGRLLNGLIRSLHKKVRAGTQLR